jgi:hypothetical protein
MLEVASRRMGVFQCLSLVMVLDDGNDKAKLENSSMPEFNQMGLEAT